MNLHYYRINSNQTKGITTIKFNTPTSDIITLLITDMLGKVVYSETISSVGMNELNLDLNLNSGFIIIHTE